MRIGVIQGHPDPAGGHFCHALARAYQSGAEAAGHEVRTVDIAAIEFPLLRTQQEFEHGSVPDTLKPAQELLAWADHLVIVYPLWHGDMPASAYRWFFGAHSLKSFERSVLHFLGIRPARTTLIGMVGGALDEGKSALWLDQMRTLGNRGR